MSYDNVSIVYSINKNYDGIMLWILPVDMLQQRYSYYSLQQRQIFEQDHTIICVCVCVCVCERERDQFSSVY